MPYSDVLVLLLSILYSNSPDISIFSNVSIISLIPNASNIFIILLSILMSSSAHIFLKKGMMTHALIAVKPDGVIKLIWTIGTNPWVFGGMCLHVGALVVWLWALSKVDITFAYPFLSLGYVLVSAMAWLWLGEELGMMRSIGMGIIIIGILVLAKAG